MKAELVKRQDRWDLYGEDGSKIASSAPNPFKRLSIKNCEAIENGYDLDELVKTTFPSLENCGVYLWMSETDRNRQRSAFITGFQKALSILGDKKFSEEDISKAIDFGVHVEAGNIDIDYKRYGTKENQFIQSLQQTEFDVEICYHVDSSNDRWDTFNSPLITSTGIPKLDADSCLILKRI